jgi:hypothetical protein
MAPSHAAELAGLFASTTTSRCHPKGRRNLMDDRWTSKREIPRDDDSLSQDASLLPRFSQVTPSPSPSTVGIFWAKISAVLVACVK